MDNSIHFSEVKYIEKVIKTPERENKSLITEQQMSQFSIFINSMNRGQKSIDEYLQSAKEK